MPKMRLVAHSGVGKKSPSFGREAEARCSRNAYDRICRRRIDTAFCGFCGVLGLSSTLRFASLHRDFWRARFIPS